MNSEMRRMHVSVEEQNLVGYIHNHAGLGEMSFQLAANLNASASMCVIRLFMNLADSTVEAALRTSLSMERRPASTMSTCVRYGVGKSERRESWPPASTRIKRDT